MWPLPASPLTHVHKSLHPLHAQRPPQIDKRPSFIVLLVDDLGYVCCTARPPTPVLVLHAAATCIRPAPAFVTCPPPATCLTRCTAHRYDDIALHHPPGLVRQYLKTPNLDRMLHSGLGFSNWYTTPMCSTSRAELLSGRWYPRTGSMYINSAWVAVKGRAGGGERRVLAQQGGQCRTGGKAEPRPCGWCMLCGGRGRREGYTTTGSAG